VSTRLQEPLGGGDVVAQVLGEVRSPRRANAGLACDVVHAVDSPEQRRDRHLGMVRLDEGEPWTRVQRRQVLLLAAAAVVASEAVQPHHLVAVVEQGFAEMGADESGCTRHQRDHIDSPRIIRSVLAHRPTGGLQADIGNMLRPDEST
jgi:hypothetical protein